MIIAYHFDKIQCESLTETLKIEAIKWQQN